MIHRLPTAGKSLLKGSAVFSDIVIQTAEPPVLAGSERLAKSGAETGYGFKVFLQLLPLWVRGGRAVRQIFVRWKPPPVFGTF